MILINDKSRKCLHEGRQYQMGFAFLSKKDKDKFETVQPISPCKDYLNDVVFAEQTGKQVVAYGFNYHKQGIFDGEKSYIAISICDYMGTCNHYEDYQEHVDNLNNNFKNLEKFLQYFDEALGLKVKTSINKVKDNLYIVEFDYFWSKYTYLISLYTLLIRAGQFYEGEETPTEFLQSFNAFPEDNYLVSRAVVKLELILEGNIPKQNFDEQFPYSTGTTAVHDCGIISYKF